MKNKKRPRFFSFALKYILLLYFVSIGSPHTVNNLPCEKALPLHHSVITTTTASACGWTCEEGYYSTVPTNVGGISTCRPCSKPRACGVGRFATLCMESADSKCMPCPSLPEGQIYTTAAAAVGNNNGCASTRCADGWYAQNASGGVSCQPCPPGAYCVGGELFQCAGNCSTGATISGISSPLECKPPPPPLSANNNNENMMIALSIKFTMSGAELAKSSSECSMELNKGMQAWLTYGTFHGCAVDMLGPTLGTVTCTVTAAQCVAEEYVGWLVHTLQQANVLAWVTPCLLPALSGSNYLRLGAPLVMRQSYSSLQAKSSPVNANNNRNYKAPLDSPPLISEPLKWGVSPAEALGAMGLAVLVCSGLVVALLLLCALCRTSSFRRRLLDKFYAKVKARHAAAFGNLKALKKDIP